MGRRASAVYKLKQSTLNAKGGKRLDEKNLNRRGGSIGYDEGGREIRDGGPALSRDIRLTLGNR